MNRPFSFTVEGLPGDQNAEAPPGTPWTTVWNAAMRQMPSPYTPGVPADLATASAWIRAWVQVMLHPDWDKVPAEIHLAVLDWLAFARLGRFRLSAMVQDYEQGVGAWRAIAVVLPEHFGVRDGLVRVQALAQQPEQMGEVLAAISEDRRKRPLILLPT